MKRKIKRVPKSIKQLLKYHELMWNEIIKIFNTAIKENTWKYDGLAMLKKEVINKLFEGEYFDELYSNCFICDWFKYCGECIMKTKCFQQSTLSAWATLNRILDDLDIDEVPDLQLCILLAESIRDLEN